MEKPSFLNLSDEILLYIFSYLEGIDKINTYRTCVRFSNVLCDRRLSRKLKLIGNYNVVVKDIKCYLKPKMVRENMRILDLTNCYWLLPSEICSTVLNLKNLVALYLVDVHFTFSQIVKMVNVLIKLKYLSFSWPEMTYNEVSESWLSSLEFLYIFFPKVAAANWFHIISWICRCKNLKQLYLICAPGNNSPDHIYTVLEQNVCSELALDTLVIVGLQNDYLLQMLKSVCRIPPESSKCLWLPTNAHAWKLYFTKNKDAINCLNPKTPSMENLACENYRITADKKGKVKRFYCSVFKPPVCVEDEYESLEQLGVVQCFSFTLLQHLHMLTVLCIPVCCFSGLEEQEKDASLLPEWCPEIQHLELNYSCIECKNKRKNNESLLDIIAGWAKLKTLKLSDFRNLRSGKAFDKIFKSCKNLEKLFIRDLGALCGYVFEFTKALKSCKNLKDFRFEETFVTPLEMAWLFEALADCPLIERTAFFFRNNAKTPTETSVLNLIERSSKLIFLCILSPSMTDAQRKRLMKTVTTRFTPTRPALYCSFIKSRTVLEYSEKVPAVHMFEMLYPDISGPFELPYNRDFFFEVPDLNVASSMLS